MFVLPLNIDGRKMKHPVLNERKILLVNWLANCGLLDEPTI